MQHPITIAKVKTEQWPRESSLLRYRKRIGHLPMAFPFWIKRLRQKPRLGWTLVKTYRSISSASVETIWKKLSDITDLSWNPMLSSPNRLLGLEAKPGLIYRAMLRWIPIPSQLFIETVKPQQFLSIRIFAFPGIEERVTYQIGSDVTGTFISYSIMLRGWLTPLIWPLMHYPAQRVAGQLARAAEREGDSTNSDWLSRLIDF